MLVTAITTYLRGGEGSDEGAPGAVPGKLMICYRPSPSPDPHPTHAVLDSAAP